MTFAAGLILIAAAIVVVGWPFFQKAARGAALAPPEPMSHWERQKLESYGAIKDAEFDFETGKMSEADYQFIREKYATRALEAIAALEKAKPRPHMATTRPVRFLYCPDCGNKLPARAKFCPGCGRALGREDDAA